MYVFFFFKQKTAYEMRISDWSSDVCSSDLHCRQRVDWRDAERLPPAPTQCRPPHIPRRDRAPPRMGAARRRGDMGSGARDPVRSGAEQIGRGSCRERVCQYVETWVGAVSLQKK